MWLHRRLDPFQWVLDFPNSDGKNPKGWINKLKNVLTWLELGKVSFQEEQITGHGVTACTRTQISNDTKGCVESAPESNSHY